MLLRVRVVSNNKICIPCNVLQILLGFLEQFECLLLTFGMCVKDNTIIYAARASNSKRYCDAWSLLLLAATVRSFAHMPLGISDRNSTKLFPRASNSINLSLHAGQQAKT